MPVTLDSPISAENKVAAGGTVPVKPDDPANIPFSPRYTIDSSFKSTLDNWIHTFSKTATPQFTFNSDDSKTTSADWSTFGFDQWSEDKGWDAMIFSVSG